MTAKDYAAHVPPRHPRLRANGVDNAVNVVAYMGNEKWMAQSWWKDLYPGDDVVDWIGLDSYVSVEKGYYHYGDFGDLLDRQPTGGGLGWYDWAVTQPPDQADHGGRVGHVPPHQRTVPTRPPRSTRCSPS